MIIPLNPLRCRDIDLGSTPLSKEVLEKILGQCQSRDIIHFKTMSGPDSYDETLTLLADKNSIIVRFPNNVNQYSVKYGKSFKTVCSFIMDNYDVKSKYSTNNFQKN